jgi:hypothetical protein
MKADPTQTYNQDDATSFIRLNCCFPQGGIAAKVQSKRQKQK